MLASEEARMIGRPMGAKARAAKLEHEVMTSTAPSVRP
jgi:hypothetical protein